MAWHVGTAEFHKPEAVHCADALPFITKPGLQVNVHTAFSALLDGHDIPPFVGGKKGKQN